MLCLISKDKKLAIKDPEVLKMFGKTVGKKGPKKFVPAELSKQYDLNKYREVLQQKRSRIFISTPYR